MLGALNHTVLAQTLNRRLDLVLPHLRYGYVMFNRTPRTVDISEVIYADGRRAYVDELVATPSPGYKRARWAINLRFEPALLGQLCRQAHLSEPVIFETTRYLVSEPLRPPLAQRRLRCTTDGKLARPPL